MTAPLTSVTLKEIKGDDYRSKLWAVIRDDGALELERSDYGALPERVWGRDEYEYNVTVAAEYKDTVLLLLMQSAGLDDTTFKAWLSERGVPYQTSSWP